MAVTRRGLIRPMLATPGPLPPPATDAGWAYEPKWDGVRAVAYLGTGPPQLLSRADQDMTARYPELARLGDAHDALVLDGGLVLTASRAVRGSPATAARGDAGAVR